MKQINIISIILALVMLFTLIPFAAIAEGEAGGVALNETIFPDN